MVNASPSPSRVVQYVTGLKKGEKVKVHRGTTTNAIFTGTILDVLNDGEYYKVAPDGSGETESWIEEVVYPESTPSIRIEEFSRQQLSAILSRLPSISGPASPKERIPKEETPKKEESGQDRPLSDAFTDKINAYIQALKETGETGAGSSFNGRKIVMLNSLGAKIREDVAKQLGLRYAKKEKIVSFMYKGVTEKVSVEDIAPKLTLKSHSEVENQLKGEYEHAIRLGYGEEINSLMRNPVIADLFKMKRIITPGDLGEVRAAKKLQTIYDKDSDGDYLIIGSVHFWGCVLPGTAWRDISNELDHLIVRLDKDKGQYNVIGLYNTKAGTGQQSNAKKQNENAREILLYGTKGEYEWTVKDKDTQVETTYKLKQIKGTIQKGPASTAGKEFALQLGNYTVESGLKTGTIGASAQYDIKLSNSGVLANALTYLLKGGQPDQQRPVFAENNLSSLEARLRGKALFEAEQADEHEDEFADWDELWGYLDEHDQQLLKTAWEQ